MALFRLEEYLFNEPWMERWVDVWNSEPNKTARNTMRGTGDVLFVLMEEQEIIRSTLVHWGADGNATASPGASATAVPSFFAPVMVWESLIYAYYTPIQAVVSKKMEFEGRMMFATKFSQQFHLVAEVAIAVNRHFMQV